MNGHIRFLTNARFDIWGEEDTERRFVRWSHPELKEPVTFLLEENHVRQLISALQQELPPAARTTVHKKQ